MENCTAGKIILCANYLISMSLCCIELNYLDNDSSAFLLGLILLFFWGARDWGGRGAFVGVLFFLLALVMIPLWKSPVQSYIVKAMKNIFLKDPETNMSCDA